MPERVPAQTLIQRAIDLLETSACFERKAAIKCHIIGIQGEKRRVRYLYRKSQNIVDCLQHGPLDIFDPPLELYPNVGTTDVSGMTDPETSMRKIIDTLCKIHDEAHGIANDMVVSKMKDLSEPIYHFCSCLMSIVGEMRRNYRSYERSGWDWHHITRHQETECNVHDKYEEKEESQGYFDGKEA